MPGDAVLIAGSAGSGKTTLALQYLVNGVTQFGDRGIYVTFEELPNQIYRDAKSFGWDLRKLEEENKFRLICTSPNLLMQTEGGENILDESIKEIQPQRIVIDSLSHLQMYVPESDLRKETYRLIMYLKTKRLKLSTHMGVATNSWTIAFSDRSRDEFSRRRHNSSTIRRDRVLHAQSAGHIEA